MEYRRFGKTELKVSAIGFGCWEIGGTYGRINESQFTRAVRSAVDNGINCFDTAEAYGMGVSERALARALDDIVRQGKARYIGVSNFRLPLPQLRRHAAFCRPKLTRSEIEE